MKNIKIVLVEDQQLFRNGMRALLEAQHDISVEEDLEDGRSFLDYMASLEVLPDIVLMDMNLPDFNGFELTTIMQKQYPAIKVIVLTVFSQDRFVSKMIEAGAAGYLEKNCDIGEVVEAIRTVYKTGFYFNERTIRAMRDGYKRKSRAMRSLVNIPVELTERETETLKLICMEYTNVEIAERLSISSRTVEGHRNNLLDKTGAKNTAGLVVFAIANQIYEPPILQPQ